MAATPSSPTNPAGDDRNLVPANETAGLGFEEKLQLWWEKNSKLVVALVAIVLLGILGKGVWEYIDRRNQAEIGGAYAAATTPEQLKAFASEHDEHPLAGIAHLRMADEAYTAGRSADAIAGYEKAIDVLEDGPLAARAKLGRALARAQAGNTAEAVTELKQLLSDAEQMKAIRAEAGYHLASLAASAGNPADVQMYADQLMQIDPMSPWSQRAMSLRATLPAAAQPAATKPETAGEAGEKKDDAAPKVELKLPGK